MDFLERLKEHIEALPGVPDVIEIGTYNTKGNSVAIRPAPSNIDFRDMAKGKVYTFLFQILVHHKNNLTAYTTSQELLNGLDMAKNITSSDNSFALISVQCSTVPNFIEDTSYGSLWSSMYTAELYII